MSSRVSLALAKCVPGVPMMVEPGLRSSPPSAGSRYSNTVLPGVHSYPAAEEAKAANPQTVHTMERITFMEASPLSPSPRRGRLKFPGSDYTI